jgi:fluoroquinolone transport system permease protein
MKKMLLLSLGDLRNISRDPMLMMVFIAPILMAIVMKIGLPLAAAAAWDRLAFDLTVHYPFILSLVILFVPMLVGTMVGFIILEDLDENLLAYFAVTPVSKAGYLFYRIITPVLLSFFLTLVMVWIIGLVPVNYLILIPVLLIASLEAPLFALFLGVFAANRIEGLALSKAFGILLLAPLAGYLIASPWQLAAGILPPYWVSKSFLAGMEGGSLFGIFTVTGLLIHVAYIYLLLARFNRKVI